MSHSLQGRCRCGANQYFLQTPTDFVAHCHCADCRSASGAPFITWTSVPETRFSLNATAKITWYDSSPGVRWGFCSCCGATLFYTSEASKGKIYATVASLVDPIDQVPQAHVSYEEHSFAVYDGLPKTLGKSTTELPQSCDLFILYVSDQATSAAFYSALFERSPRLNVPGMTEFVLPHGGRLGLMPEAGIQRLLQLESGTGSRAELYLRSKTVSEAAATLARAHQHGATAISPLKKRDWGELVGYCLDPDGHVIGVAAPMPKR